MLECVINASSSDPGILADLTQGLRSILLDLHHDSWHNRAVITLGGLDDDVQAAARVIARRAVALIDLTAHVGAHPRLGVLDVVPFVPIGPEGSTLQDAVVQRNTFGKFAGEQLDLPCFCYGPERSLPDVRRTAFRQLSPDFGPSSPDPRTGACCIGARMVLVAFNLVLERPDLMATKAIAASIRSKYVRALGLQVGDEVQVSCNLMAPSHLGPAQIYDLVATREKISHAELVGLIPADVLHQIPKNRWNELDLSENSTIEARLSAHRRT